FFSSSTCSGVSSAASSLRCAEQRLESTFSRDSSSNTPVSLMLPSNGGTIGSWASRRGYSWFAAYFAAGAPSTPQTPFLLNASNNFLSLIFFLDRGTFECPLP